jgi:hypothetical protein
MAREAQSSPLPTPVTAAGSRMRLAARRPSIRLARWAGGRPGQVEQARPVDHQDRRDRAEAEQVGQQRHRLGVAVHLIAVADLAVAIAVGGVGELQRDPLVVPGGGPAGLGEQLRLGHPVAAQPVHQAVVEMQHGQVQLAHEQVDVVAGVADQGHALGVAGQVGRPASLRPTRSLAGSSRSYRKGMPAGPSP